jgi:hypothetical protein
MKTEAFQMSRMPAIAEFEIQAEQTVEAPSPGALAILAAALGRLVQQLSLWPARRRLYRYASADHRFLGDIGVGHGEAESVVRHGRRRKR